MKMKSYDEITASVPTLEELIENGMLYDDLCGEFYWNSEGIYCYDQQFDKPMEEGGKPFTGIAFDASDNDTLDFYTKFEDGWEVEDVHLYPSGRLKSYSKSIDTECYAISWYENGVVSYTIVHHRRDLPDYEFNLYFVAKSYDKNGRILQQRIRSEFDFIYDYDNPDVNFEVTFHKNGEFKSIKNKKPTRADLYTYFEFDETGFPVKWAVNPLLLRTDR